MPDLANTSTQIIVALIGLLGAVLGALAPIVAKRRQAKITRILWVIIGFAVGAGMGILVPTIMSESNECAKLRIVAPAGSPTEVGSGVFKVNHTVKVAWTPQCVTTVQAYQRGKLIREYKDQASSREFDIGDPNSGLTEVKVWGTGKTNNSVWVFIEDTQAEEQSKQPSQNKKNR
jgi:hypothetical protein